MSATLPPAMQRLLDFLSELGPRWGLPADACRVHGYLYLTRRPASEHELNAALRVDRETIANALEWLKDFGLVAPMPDAAWRTESDPWELMVRALDERRRRESGPVLDTLRECQRMAAEHKDDPILRQQIAKLLALAEDLIAIDAQANRLSPSTLRQMMGLGAWAARFLDRTIGRGSR